ncbi:MAG: ArdC-like ssDNA-binding domain-containing protein [Bacteroidota bacterium]
MRQNGGQVRRGERSTIIVFWRKSTEQDEQTMETRQRFLLRYYHVFNTEQAHFDDQGKEKISRLNGKVSDRQNEMIMDA